MPSRSITVQKTIKNTSIKHIFALGDMNCVVYVDQMYINPLQKVVPLQTLNFHQFLFDKKPQWEDVLGDYRALF